MTRKTHSITKTAVVVFVVLVLGTTAVAPAASTTSPISTAPSTTPHTSTDTQTTPVSTATQSAHPAVNITDFNFNITEDGLTVAYTLTNTESTSVNTTLTIEYWYAGEPTNSTETVHLEPGESVVVTESVDHAGSGWHTFQATGTHGAHHETTVIVDIFICGGVYGPRV